MMSFMYRKRFSDQKNFFPIQECPFFSTNQICNMRKGNIRYFIWIQSIFFAFIFVFLPTHLAGESNYSLEDAKKVLRIIAEIEREQDKNSKPPFEKVRISEEELNAYIAYRIDVERSVVMKELKLKLFDEKRIEGKIFMDLKGHNPSHFLRSEMNFYFSGILEIRENQVRLNLKELYLEDQKINPMLLDVVIFIAARIQGEEAGGISDWYELPLGIKEILTKPGEVWFNF